jgi:hypothetical protein
MVQYECSMTFKFRKYIITIQRPVAQYLQHELLHVFCNFWSIYVTVDELFYILLNA